MVEFIRQNPASIAIDQAMERARKKQASAQLLLQDEYSRNQDAALRRGTLSQISATETEGSPAYKPLNRGPGGRLGPAPGDVARPAVPAVTVPSTISELANTPGSGGAAAGMFSQYQDRTRAEEAARITRKNEVGDAALARSNSLSDATTEYERGMEKDRITNERTVDAERLGNQKKEEKTKTDALIDAYKSGNIDYIRLVSGFYGEPVPAVAENAEQALLYGEFTEFAVKELGYKDPEAISQYVAKRIQENQARNNPQATASGPQLAFPAAPQAAPKQKPAPSPEEIRQNAYKFADAAIPRTDEIGDPIPNRPARVQTLAERMLQFISTGESPASAPNVSPSSALPPGSAAAATLPQGMTLDDVLAAARGAIAAGKDRAQIIDRLRQWGIDPAGL